MKFDWRHLVAGGGLLLILRHIGFALGFGAQVIWEGMVDGVNARKAVNQDATTILDKVTGQKT